MRCSLQLDEELVCHKTINLKKIYLFIKTEKTKILKNVADWESIPSKKNIVCYKEILKRMSSFEKKGEVIISSIKKNNFKRVIQCTSTLEPRRSVEEPSSEFVKNFSKPLLCVKAATGSGKN